MKLSKLVRLRNNYYYVIIDVEYKIFKNFKMLCLKDCSEDHWDGGDCSIIIEKIEDEYKRKNDDKYDEHISFMNDVLFIYDRMPFISGIRDVYFNKDNMITSDCYISKEEIEEYIKKFNIKMKYKDNYISLLDVIRRIRDE